jgi:ABC-type nickel/cobalt efflux system permease component RcnA
METLFALQRWICSAIATELGGYATTGNLRTLASVLPLGILFGALHARRPAMVSERTPPLLAGD